MRLSLVLNIAVLIPVLAALAANRAGAIAVFGERTPARGILQSIYFAILVMSAALLAVQDLHATAGLLGVQIVYKVTTPFTVGTVKNPVVISNLLIAAFHGIALWDAASMFQS